MRKPHIPLVSGEDIPTRSFRRSTSGSHGSSMWAYLAALQCSSMPRSPLTLWSLLISSGEANCYPTCTTLNLYSSTELSYHLRMVYVDHRNAGRHPWRLSRVTLRSVWKPTAAKTHHGGLCLPWRHRCGKSKIHGSNRVAVLGKFFSDKKKAEGSTRLFAAHPARIRRHQGDVLHKRLNCLFSLFLMVCRIMFFWG